MSCSKNIVKFKIVTFRLLVHMYMSKRQLNTCKAKTYLINLTTAYFHPTF